MNAAAHPRREQLSALVFGGLPDEEIEPLAEHVETCPECEATVQELETMADSLIDRIRQPPPVDEYAGEPEFHAALANVVELKNRLRPDGETDASVPDLGTLGEYRLLEKLGEGGMGAVYKALHTKLDRVVALKVLPKGRIDSEHAVARFEREMKAVGRLSHPNIVQAHDAREIDGQHFLVMEYVDGQDLNELVRCIGPMPVADACEMTRQAALALQCAHEHGLVHRDVKPSNLMITSGGQIKLLDLGLARFQAEDAPAGREVTAAGQTMGTPDYMAPEQIADTHTVDIRADIYALGCTFYKLLAGRPPFSGPDYKTAFDKQTGHVKDQPPPIGRIRMDLPDELVAVIDKMLSKDPAERFATPAEVATVLEPFAAGCDLPGMLKQAARIISPDEDSLSEISTEDRSSAIAGTEPHISAPKPVGKRGRWKWVAVGAVLAGVVALGVILTLTNRYGTLVVECDDPNVQVAVLQNGEEVEVVNAESGWKIALKSGTYDVEMKGGDERFQIDQDSVIVKRGGKETVRVTLKRPGGPKQPEPGKTLLTGEPISRFALVARPAKLKGVQSWTIETRGSRAMIRALKFSPDDKLLAAAGDDGILRIWDPKSGRLVRIMLGHQGIIQTVSWSPDGKTLATGSDDATARLWDVASGRCFHVLRDHEDAVAEVMWSPAGKTLATRTDKIIRLWNTESGRLEASLERDQDTVLTMAWSPDSKQLVTGSKDKAVQVWDASTGKQIHALEGHEKPVTQVSWSPAANLVASGSSDGTVRLWKSDSGELISIIENASKGAIVDMAWSSEGNMIAVAASPSGLLLWDVGKNKQEGTWEFPWHLCSVKGVHWLPDNRGLACWVESYGWNLVLVDLATRDIKKAHKIPGPVILDLSHDRTAASCSLQDNSIQIWRISSGTLGQTLHGHEPLANPTWLPNCQLGTQWRGGAGIWRGTDGRSEWYRTLPEPPRREQYLAWSPDGGRVISGVSEKNLSGSSTVWNIRPQTMGVALKEQRPSGRSSVAWSPQGEKLAFIAVRDNLHVWDSHSWQLLHSIENSGYYYLYAWSPDGKKLLLGKNYGTGTIWDVESGKEVQVLEDLRGFKLTAGAWSPDGEAFALLFAHSLSAFAKDDQRRYEGVIQVFRGESNHRSYKVKTKPGDAQFLRWSQDGQEVIFLDSHGKMTFLDPVSGPKRHGAVVPTADCSLTPDRKLVAFPVANAIQLLQVEDGKPHGTLVALRENQALMLTPDGHYKATPMAEPMLVYIVQTDQGQETLIPEEFAKRYGWKNDPSRVGLLGGGE